MKVVVTGGAGRLGASVVTGLVEAGHEVVSVDRAALDGLPAAEQIAVDLTDAAATDTVFAQVRPEAVVHLAAIATPFSAPEAVIWDTNTSIAFHVMQSAVDHGATRVLASSSPTPLGYGARSAGLRSTCRSTSNTRCARGTRTPPPRPRSST